VATPTEKLKIRYVIKRDLLATVAWPTLYMIILGALILIFSNDREARLGAPIMVLLGAGYGWLRWRFEGNAVQLADGEMILLVPSLYSRTCNVPQSAPLMLEWKVSPFPLGYFGGGLWFQAEPLDWEWCGPFRDPEKVMRILLRYREFGIDDPELAAMAERGEINKVG
jgi:hypothetical protein